VAENDKQPATVGSRTESDGSLILTYSGRLDCLTTGAVWRKTSSLLHRQPGRLVVDAGEVSYCDGSGIALFFSLRLRGLRNQFPVDIRNLRPELVSLLERFEAGTFDLKPPALPPQTNVAAEVGHWAWTIWQDIFEQVAFIGELAAWMLRLLVRPAGLRWNDFFLMVERSGANAIGIIALLGFLFGLILAFSGAISMQKFGVEVYVADLTAIALIRVLGPFLTAIIMAGRTGSSFAAELGTMKINNEIDALATMGLDPVRFLVLPRVLATTLVTPLLAVLANLSGLVGAAVVFLWLGFPLVTFINHVQRAIDIQALMSGLVKAVVFGFLIGAVGCLRGLQTELGPSAVGISTTRAVVSGIVLIVVTEGVFAVIYYCLGI
jgi:phospholipid/cholesterol/gamma-HCH transport system permease protein